MKLCSACLVGIRCRYDGMSNLEKASRRLLVEYEKGETAPFPAWDYHPIYLPDFLKMQVAHNTPLSEPLYFYLFFAKRQDKAAVGKESRRIIKFL